MGLMLNSFNEILLWSKGKQIFSQQVPGLVSLARTQFSKFGKNMPIVYVTGLQLRMRTKNNFRISQQNLCYRYSTVSMRRFF